MDKRYIITFSISVIVLFTLGIVMLMLMTPQEITVVDSKGDAYEGINKNEYTYMQTKDISKESLIKEYVISGDDILNFQKYSNYKSGNSDPFTPSSDVQTQTQVDNSTDKTTNSNNGVSNPASTGK